MRACAVRHRRTFRVGYDVTRSRMAANSVRAKVVNQGGLSDHDRGDPTTEPAAYRNRKNVAKMLRLERFSHGGLTREASQKKWEGYNVSDTSTLSLHSGMRPPQSAAEIGVTRIQDEQLVEGDNSAPEYTRCMHDVRERDAMRQAYREMKFPSKPSATEYSAIVHRLHKEDSEEERTEAMHQRLISEHGMYPAKRLDAYMLGDESAFPPWVGQLPFAIRDRVRYGNLGLTEDDAVLRVRLMRLSIDRRLSEWKRLRGARSYKLGIEEQRISPPELRRMRMRRQQFHALRWKRKQRASQVQRLALRRPEDVTAWPSTAVDYSERLATIARHVEVGLPTNGQWPLDREALAKATLRRRREDADHTFQRTDIERTAERNPRVGLATVNMIRSMEHEKPRKHLSRKSYAHLVNGVKEGVFDDRGRHLLTMRLQSHRVRPYQTTDDIALDKELSNEPSPNFRGRKQRVTGQWMRHEDEWKPSEGLVNSHTH